MKYLLDGLFSYLRRCNIYFRDRYYKKKYLGIDKTVKIGYEVLIDSPKNNIFIGEYTYLQRNCQVVGNVFIGKDCSIASNVNIWANTHDRIENSPDSIKEGKIIIGNNVWIGSNCFIRENVKIGNNSIIGANSIVTKNIPNNETWGGYPLKE